MNNNNNMPNDSNLMSPSDDSEPPLEVPDYDLTLHRLRLLSGERTPTDVLRWLGLNLFTFSNWKRRGRINFDPIIAELLRRRISLDWFFAPYENLFYPAVGQLGGINDICEQQQQSYAVDMAIEALARVDPILERHGAELSEENRQIMSDTYFKRRGNVVTLTAALNQVAKALANSQHER